MKKCINGKMVEVVDDEIFTDETQQPTTEQQIQALNAAVADLAIQIMTTGGDSNV